MKLNVLVVDDSAVMRQMIIRTLRLSGLPLGEVHEAANGAAALAQVAAHWTDLVLADINMPVMNGEELINRLRESEATRDLPVIVVSSESSEARIDRLTEKNVGFVHKPFTPEAIAEAAKLVLGLSDDQLQAGGGAPAGGDF